MADLGMGEQCAYLGCRFIGPEDDDTYLHARETSTRGSETRRGWEDREWRTREGGKVK